MRRFINERLAHYDTARNQPHIAGTSELSAYLHFGHLGPLTVALAVREPVNIGRLHQRFAVTGHFRPDIFCSVSSGAQT